MISSEVFYFFFFSIAILAVLILDLTVIGRHSHVLSLKEAVSWTGVWVSLALLFYVFIIFYGDKFHGINNLNDLVSAASV